jgi:DNA helicase-2/ATP-dependent DNA helicase PcrA
LEGFLEESALVTDTDDMEEGAQSVTLMTLHAAKGLEFPVVFLVALEGRLLPHERSADDPAQFEERRLLFVGITRAQAEVHLSYARTREFRGRRAMTVPSDFIADLPHNEMIVEDVTSTLASETAESPAPFADRLRSSGPLLTTAAAMAGEAPRQSGAPDAWREGMLVSHPQYGLGRVVALDGVGQNRKATVEFPGSGKRKFVLRSAPLQPVGSR